MNDEPYSIENLYGLTPSASSVSSAASASSQSSVASVEEQPAPKGIAAHDSYLRRLDLKLTEAEAAALNTISAAQTEALCVGDIETANALERQASPVFALICERLADEARELALSQPDYEQNAFAECAQWLTNAAEFGFESNEDRDEFKKLLA